jgi:hypothetical protein
VDGGSSGDGQQSGDQELFHRLEIVDAALTKNIVRRLR